MRYYLKYVLLIILPIIKTLAVSAQFGDPVYNQTFGEGNEDPNSIGPPLSHGKTDFTYVNALCPPPGSYTIVRRMNVKGCFNLEWIDLSQDHGPTDYGMFMLVNNSSSPGNRIVYEDTTSKINLCGGAAYDFSVAIINTDMPSNCQPIPDFPVFELRLEDVSGNLIQKDTTPAVQYAVPPPTGYKFSTYGFNFTMPDNIDRLVVRITLLHGAYNCGEDFAIDDIVISPYGPKAQITFSNEDQNNIVKSVCYQDNKTISMSGSMDPYYTNSALQWQQSIDSGATWTDIPGANSNTYVHNFSSPDTFLFRLSGADASKIANPTCRVVSNDLTVKVDGIPSNFKITNNSPVCAGSDLVFDAEGGTTYTWTGPNGFYDDIQFPHIPNVVLADSGTYNVQVISAGGCKATGNTHVKIIGTDVKAGPDTSVCKGTIVTLHTSTGTSYAWSPPDGLSNSTIQSPNVQPASTTTYVVKVISADGCSDTAKATVKVLNGIVVKADFSGPEYICKPSDTATFTNLSTGNIVSWQWNFGNGQTSTMQNPPVEHYYISDNRPTYTVSLKISDSARCKDSVYHLIKIAGNCYIAVPAAFTPNDDGLNDYLYPLNAYKATNLRFRVYDRFGRLIFETRDWTKKWDGTKANIPQPAGTYVWTLDYDDAANNKVSLHGTTVLLR